MTGNWHRIFIFVKPFKREMLLACLLTAILTILSLTPPLILKVLIDEVVTSGNWGLFNLLIGLMILLPLSHSIISFVNNYIISSMAVRLVYRIRIKLYEHLLNLSLSFHQKMPSGVVISRLMGDTGAVQSLIAGSTITLVVDSVSCIFALIALLTMNFSLTLVLIAVLPLYVLNYIYFSTRIRSANLSFRKKMDSISGILYEKLAGAGLIKSFGRERYETRQFVSNIHESLDIARGAVVHSQAFSNVANLISGIGNSAIYCLGCYLVISGEMGYGTVLAFCAYSMQMLSPALRFTELSNTIQQTFVSVERIFEILETKPSIRQPEKPLTIKSPKGRIKLENVTFGYDSRTPVITNFSLDIPGGTLVALVGHTGCGKTTIISLLLRLYDPDSGRICLDETDIREIAHSTLAKSIGVVLQDTVLFNTSIRENISYGMKDVSMEKVVSSAKLAEAHDFITKLTHGYETLIGEGGVKFSVGEAQRIAIARSILREPSVLILDEATSSLDSESEAKIQKAMTRIMEGRTSVVIAHRLSTIMNANLIVVMEKGRIVEMGTHESLIKKHFGFYHRFYDEQFKINAG